MALTQDTDEEGSFLIQRPYKEGSIPLDDSLLDARPYTLGSIPPSDSNLIQLAGNYSFPNTEGVETSTDEGRSTFEDPYSTKNILSATVVSGPNKGADVTPQAGGTPTPKPNMQNVIDWMQGDVTPETLAAGQKKTLDAARQKVDEDEAASKSGIGAMTHRMRELESIRNATAHTIADLPPKWDADKEGRDRIRGPLESFGSFASVFAIAASAFTKQPAINALTASAAAMTAIHQSDAEGYERAYRAWKDNTELVHKRFEMERQVFQDTSTLFDKDSNLWVAKMKANAARFDDKQMQALLEAGLWGDAYKLMESRQLAMDHMTKGAEQFEDFNSRLHYRESLQTAAEKAHPDWTDQQKAMYKLLTLRETQPGKTEAENIVHRAAREHFERTGTPMSPEEEARLLQQARYAPGRSKEEDKIRLITELMKPVEEGGRGLAYPEAAEEAGRILASGKIAVEKTKAEVKPLSAEQAEVEQLKQEFMDGKIDESEYKKKLDEIMKAKKQGANAAVVMGPDWTPDKPMTPADEEMAKSIASYKLAPPSPFTRGRPENKQLMARVEKLSEEINGAPYDEKKFRGDLATARTAAPAQARAYSSALKQQVEMQAGLNQFEATATKNLDRLVELARKTDRSGVPAINRWVYAGRKSLAGDPDVAALHAQWTVVTPEVAKIIVNPRLVGQLTDTQIKEVRDAIALGSSVKQFEAVTELLKGDFKRRRDSINEEIARLEEALDAISRGEKPAKPATTEQFGGWH